MKQLVPLTHPHTVAAARNLCWQSPTPRDGARDRQNGLNPRAQRTLEVVCNSPSWKLLSQLGNSYYHVN